MQQTLARSATAEAYRDFAPLVQRCLAGCGVRRADLPDLCHDVFLVVHRNDQVLHKVVRFDLWLREVCRRVAAGYRRRASHRLETLSAGGSSSERLEGGCTPAVDLTDSPAEDDRVRRALAVLDDESRELLALHDVGELPLAELARLTLHDRKTVRKRLQRARRRLAEQLRRQPPAAPGERVEAQLREPTREWRTSRALSGFEVLVATRDLRVAQIGNVAMTHWPTVPSVEAFEQVLQSVPRVIQKSGGAIVYLALVETSGLPNRVARRRLIECIELIGPHTLQYAAVLLARTSWMVQPIMNGTAILTRPRFPMHFFTELTPAAAYLCRGYALGAHGALTTTELVAAMEHLRRLPPVS